ncbi:Histidinol-phosphate aminotransferase [Sinobacterium norvegicum]|uniref:Histidinol-phosphate aminotransferase n=1 Tax=Sinobacterium norvegicum TaxID=1641715 RepID=A0ABN8EK50_9GAMM|nr:histidinol-phosphate transaminase [Sinobacterium norvegicum]CAH0992731.1 Histidinol-phosphate aminotransferase [Sinobacterium norvegicum]
MSRFWSPIVEKLTPYVAGEQPKMTNLVKLNTNENPYPPSPKAIAAIQQSSQQHLQLYPDPNSDRLSQAIADYYQVDNDCVFIGNGSDEVLAHTFQALLNHQQPILFPDISYSFYPTYCSLYQIDYQKVALDTDFAIDPDDYKVANGGIIFPNPNAPTGRLLALEAVQKILDSNPDSVVVVDEAYIDFGGDSAVSLVADYDNVVVIQTLSKSRALAGLRVGFAIAQPHLIDALERVKNSFNSYPLDKLAEAAATAAIEDREYFEQSCQKIITDRETLTKELTTLGFDIIPSTANFVFVSHKTMKAEEIAQKLRNESIIVRYFNQPRIDNMLRITIGTTEQCRLLVTQLKKILK